MHMHCVYVCTLCVYIGLHVVFMHVVCLYVVHTVYVHLDHLLESKLLMDIAKELGVLCMDAF